MVHPHVCGEYYIPEFTFFWCFGSSPRVWGIQKTSFAIFCKFWFIPTCVGNTSSHSGRSGVDMVHPHVCGEYLLSHNAKSEFDGSSPRVWGILYREYRISPYCWFIPTCVGNTPVTFSIMAFAQVHPHVCGEYNTLFSGI